MARWDDVADRMIERYKGIASRLVIYLASHWREVDPQDARTLGRGGARGAQGGVRGVNIVNSTLPLGGRAIARDQNAVIPTGAERSEA